MRRDMKDELLDIYRDFYGDGSDRDAGDSLNSGSGDAGRRSSDDADRYSRIFDAFGELGRDVDLKTFEDIENFPGFENIGSPVRGSLTGQSGKRSGNDAGKTSRAGNAGSGSYGAGGNSAGSSGSNEDADEGGQEIETEVLTQTEFTVQTKAKEAESKEPEKSGMEELNELIGLTSIKHDVKEMVGLAKVRKMREEKGMKSVPVSLHLVFSGNPGTGKTTVARILAKLYKEIGILSTGQLIETDRSGLVAGYVGQTAIKTQQKIEEAMGGVLFIDEAYTLNQEGENFGQEAIDTILKAMEDHRDKFIVIVAGYTELMKNFVDSNPGLKSRFNKFIEFPDYTVDELQAIFELQCKKYQYTLTEEADAAVREEIIRLEAEKGENFANAREVRNLFEKIITNQAARVADLEDVDEETLTTITMDDLYDSKDEYAEGSSSEEKAEGDEVGESSEEKAEIDDTDVSDEGNEGEDLSSEKKSESDNADDNAGAGAND